jgi:hypothetical protein
MTRPAVNPTPAGPTVTEGPDLVLENDLMRIIIDRRSGTIRSLINKKNGRDFVNTRHTNGMGEYLYERFGRENTDKYAKDYIKGGWDWAPAELGRINLTDDPYRASTGSDPTYKIEKTAGSAAIYLSYAKSKDNPHTYSIRYRLASGESWLEITWAIDSKPAEPWPEGGWLCFPLNIQNPQFRLGRTGGISDPAKDFVKGSNFDYCFLREGLAVLDSKNEGLGLYSPDLPGISLERPGLWKYSKDFAPQQANVFFNLFNNQWSTNFTEWIEGSWNARVYLWFIDDFDTERSLITPALEIRHPMLATVGVGKGGNLPVTESGIRISKKGLQITAFGPNPDGSGTLLRVWEKAGKSGSLTVTLPAGSRFTTARQVNLRGTTLGEPFRITSNTFDVNYKPFQPLSFILN